MDTLVHESHVSSRNIVIENIDTAQAKSRKRSGRRKRSMKAMQEKWDRSGIVHSMWMVLPETIRQRWKVTSTGTPLSEYDLFFGANVFRINRGLPFIITRTSGFYGADNYVIASTRRGEISIDFTPECHAVNITLILQKCTIDDRLDTPELRKDIFRGKYPVRVKGLCSGSDYYVYCITTDGPLDTAVSVSGSIGLRLTVI